MRVCGSFHTSASEEKNDISVTPLPLLLMIRPGMNKCLSQERERNKMFCSLRPSKILDCVQTERFREVICVGSSHCQRQYGSTTLLTVLGHLTLYKNRGSSHKSNLVNPSKCSHPPTHSPAPLAYWPAVSLSFSPNMFYITLSYTIYFLS